MSEKDDQLRAQILGYFFEEAFEGLETMESSLLGLDPDGAVDSEIINTIFRAIHSIKGSSGSFGFATISQFAHLAETLLDQIRDGSRQVTGESVNVLLEATDRLKGMIERTRDSGDPDASQAADTARKLEAILATGASGSGTSAGAASVSQAAAGPVRFEIEFEPEAGMLRSGNDPVRILRALGELGELRVEALTDRLPALADLDPESCFLSWKLTIETTATEAEVRDPFAWVEDECRLALRIVGATPAADAKSAPTSAPPPLKPAPATSAVAPARSTPATPPANNADAANKTATSIRVSTDKVDALINMVGELVITQSMLGEVGDDLDVVRIEKLREGLAQLARNTRELQESVMRIRMLPISVTFARFPRLVHDLSQKLGKQVELRMAGENTELDKTVLEQIGDPLVHLVRNSLDHGLETPDDRRAAGKPETGIILLEAYHQGGNIVIEVSDDGRGLPQTRIREKAIARGLIQPDEQLSPEQIQELIFAPGFSTVEAVSDVSGRGVGMDVVRRNIRALGGTVGISSTEGKGSTFTIRLPLTLAILDGQLVRVGAETYIIPLVSIVESLVVKRELVNSIVGRSDVYRLRNEAIPIVRLFSLFGLVPGRAELDGGLLVVVEGSGQKVGLLVDELQSQQQVVIKSLEQNYGRVPGVSGATILGDGTVALILDVAGLVDFARAHPEIHRRNAHTPAVADVAPGAVA